MPDIAAELAARAALAAEREDEAERRRAAGDDVDGGRVLFDRRLEPAPAARLGHRRQEAAEALLHRPGARARSGALGPLGGLVVTAHAP